MPRGTGKNKNKKLIKKAKIKEEEEREQTLEKARKWGDTGVSLTHIILFK